MSESKTTPMSAREIIFHCSNVIREHLKNPGPDLNGFFRGALDKAEEYLKEHEND